MRANPVRPIDFAGSDNGESLSEDPLDLDGNPRREFWYSVLTMFPFGFFPIVTIVAVLLALVMPYFTGVYGR